MKPTRQIKFFIISFIMILTAIAPAFANNGESISDLRERQEELRGQVIRANEDLEGTRREKSEAQAEIDKIDEELVKVTDEYNIITDQLEIVTDELTRTLEALEEARGLREIQYEVFRDRIRVMYMNGSIGYLEVLFNASSFSDFLSRLDFINLIAEYDRGVLDRLREIEAEIEEHVRVVERQKREVEILQAQLEKKQIELEIALNQKYALLERLAGDERMYEQQIADWLQADRDIEELIKRKEEEARRAAAAALRASLVPVTYTGGAIAWPVPSSGRITSAYGTRPSPFTGRPEFHTGLDIGAPTGTPIVAAEDGVVIFSGTMSSYGRTVIIDHQNGMSTLYAHASQLDVSVGDNVSRGQVIARVGSTGNSTGPHLHFEVRIGGVHKNPSGFLQ